MMEEWRLTTSYTLSLHQEGEEDHQTVYQTTTESLELPLPLHYSTVYSLSITANNCAGTSPPVALNSMEGKWQEVCVYHNCGFMTIFPILPSWLPGSISSSGW